MAQTFPLGEGYQKLCFKFLKKFLVLTVFLLIFSLALTLQVNASDLNADRSCAAVIDSLVLKQNQMAPHRALHISEEKLAFEIAARRQRVPEFQLIRQEAEKRGLRVWLFGGTAASFSHYVKWDVLREQGDSRFQAHRFDYDYTNIYRSTQDLDIVVSGDAHSAELFEEALKIQFPYFLGSKTAGWEVRSLTEARDDKGGLLGDFGFMNQHTDSNSTGMVELTDPPSSESLIRDIRSWNESKPSHFLKDLSEGRLTFYFSPRHFETPLAQLGQNPPLFSVIRALTKAFQYDLKVSDEDFAIFQNIIQKFDPKKELTHPYTARWIEKNGKKLFLHAVNLEYAWSTLEKLGLRQKLISIQNNPETSDSLAWWMSKEPLRVKPVGEGLGRTAESLGISRVAHETYDFHAYEGMTRSHTGEPNVFISRQNVAGETASHGDGFYTAIGKKGAKGTGITIRFEVDPQAREGTDFVLEKNAIGKKIGDGTFVIWKNKNAIRVIPESLEMSPVEYIRFLAQGNSVIEYEDQALFWKMKRKLDYSIASGRIALEQLNEIRSIVLVQIEEDAWNRNAVIEEWLKIEGARLKKDPKNIQRLVSILKSESYRVDPATFYAGLIELTEGTSLEKFVAEKWLPRLLDFKSLKGDLGIQALEKCLFADSLRTGRFLKVREFGVRALSELQAKSKDYRFDALKSILVQGVTPAVWLQAPAKTAKHLKEKAAYLAVHPELRHIVTEAEWRVIELEFDKFSSVGLFEKWSNKNLLKDAKSESFEFRSFDFPPGGIRIRLGSPVDEQGRWSGIEDQHEVTLTQSFEMQATPVTQLQWALVMRENPSHHKMDGFKMEIDGIEIEMHPNRPVEHVSWDEIQNFIQKLNKMDSTYHYRLATEAEWEYAARGGSQEPYSFGRDTQELRDYGWYLDFISENRTHDVAALKPNAYGLYDMHGNVEEWVHDRWGPVRPVHAVDPTGPSTGSQRVLRGGSADTQADYLRSASRSAIDAAGRSSSIGFRLVRTRN